MTTGFEGYAGVFDRVDRAGDIVRGGAFAGAGVVPLLWQHRGASVGRIDALYEDGFGLFVRGVVEDARVAALVRAGALAGLSVGYRATRVACAARRTILAADLVEVSLVAVPMQTLARVTRVF